MDTAGGIHMEDKVKESELMGKIRRRACDECFIPEDKVQR